MIHPLSIDLSVFSVIRFHHNEIKPIELSPYITYVSTNTY